jgi:hypothetical protein
MKKSFTGILLLSIFLFVAQNDIFGQSWDFIKEKDGIKIYTRKELDSSIKSYKGEAYFLADAEKVRSLIGNVKNFDWWAKDITEIKVLLSEKDKHIQYYLVYDVPWPLTDRDLVVDARINIDSVTGVKIVEAKPLPNAIPEKTDRIRIKRYWQKWTIIPMPNNIVHVILEGFVDPAGSIPAWLYNMVITETPWKVIKSVQTRTQSLSY